MLEGQRGAGRRAKDDRNFIEAVLWWRRTGVPGRSRGGLSTKVHLVVDALGLPLTFELTEGQRHDICPAKALVARALSRCLLADKAYDSGAFRAAPAVVAIGCVLLWLRL